MEEKLSILNNIILKNKKFKLVYIKKDSKYFIKIGSNEYMFHSPSDITNMLDIMLYMFNKRNNK